MYSYGPLHMAVRKQEDQNEHTFSNYVRIHSVVQKTCLRRWTIGKSGEIGSGISVLPARHDDDDDDDFKSLCESLVLIKVRTLINGDKSATATAIRSRNHCNYSHDWQWDYYLIYYHCICKDNVSGLVFFFHQSTPLPLFCGSYFTANQYASVVRA